MPPIASAPHRHYLASVADTTVVLTAGLVAAPAAQASDTPAVGPDRVLQ